MKMLAAATTPTTTTSSCVANETSAGSQRRNKWLTLRTCAFWRPPGEHHKPEHDVAGSVEREHRGDPHARDQQSGDRRPDDAGDVDAHRAQSRGGTNLVSRHPLGN